MGPTCGGRPARQLEQHGAHRVEVGPRVEVGRRAHLLGRHVERRAHDDPLARELQGLGGPGGAIDFDIPKSTIFATEGRPSCSARITLSGLRSRCTMPRHARRRAREHLRDDARRLGHGTLLSRRSRLPRSSPRGAPSRGTGSRPGAAVEHAHEVLARRRAGRATLPREPPHHGRILRPLAIEDLHREPLVPVRVTRPRRPTPIPPCPMGRPTRYLSPSVRPDHARARGPPRPGARPAPRLRPELVDRADSRDTVRDAVRWG